MDADTVRIKGTFAIFIGRKRLRISLVCAYTHIPCVHSIHTQYIAGWMRHINGTVGAPQKTMKRERTNELFIYRGSMPKSHVTKKYQQQRIVENELCEMRNGMNVPTPRFKL